MSNRKIRYNPISPEVEALAAEQDHNPEAVLEILRELDARHRLTPGTIADTSRALNIPPHRSYGIATFYSMLSLTERRKILRVCDGPACWLQRASETESAFRSSPEGNQMGDWSIERTSCLGLCDRAPAVLVETDQAGPVLPTDVSRSCTGWRGQVRDYTSPRPGEVRVLLGLLGKIDPQSITDALRNRVYSGVQTAFSRQPLEVIAELEASGLQGRGGAGFPVGRKLRFVASETRTPKYILCNCDESEPLIFKDRVLIDTNPHQLIAGMLVCAYACGANQGYIYIRGEYEAQARLLERAVEQAAEAGWLGENIQGSGFTFHLHIHHGAGAYICGEETALIESLEGKRGEPRNRPPFPAQAGFHGMPTCVSNVESLCAAAHIVSKGSAWWRGLGDQPGTKVYMLLGHVKKPGLFEAPLGLTLRQIIDDFGGGMREGSQFRFALTGGAAGTIVNATFLDTPIDFTSTQKGISLGAGAFLICDDQVSPVAMLREELYFFAAESCGKCTPCRVGTWRSLQILDRLVQGAGQAGDVEELRYLADYMNSSSFCGLGQAVSIPVFSALNNFPQEFAAAENKTADNDRLEN